MDLEAYSQYWNDDGIDYTSGLLAPSVVQSLTQASAPTVAAAPTDPYAWLRQNANIYGGQGILDQYRERANSVSGMGSADAAQLGFLDYYQLPGIWDFRYTKPAGPNPLDGTMNVGVFNGDFGAGDSQSGTIDHEALAAYLDSKGYKIGEAQTSPGSVYRWVEDANGNYVVEPRNYYTDDKTGAILGMLAIGGLMGAGIIGGNAAIAGGAAGASGGTAATGGSTAAAGEAGLIDAAFAAEAASAGTLAPEGVGALYGSTGQTTLGGGLLGGSGTAAAGSGSLLGSGETYSNLVDSAATQSYDDAAVQSGLLGGDAAAAAPAGTLMTDAERAASLTNAVPSDNGNTVTETTPLTGGNTGAPVDYFDKLKSFLTDPKNADLVKLMFGAGGALVGGAGGSDPYTGPMPTITQAGWSPQVQAKKVAPKPSAPGLLGVPGQAQSGLWRYGLMG